MAHNSSSVSDTCLFVELVAKLVTDVMDEGTLDVVRTAVTCTDELLTGCTEFVVPKLVTDGMDEEGTLDVVGTAVTCTDELITGCAELVVAKLVTDETLDAVDEEGTLHVVGTAVTCIDELMIGCAELVAKLVTDETLDVVGTTFVDTATGFVMTETTAV